MAGKTPISAFFVGLALCLLVCGCSANVNSLVWKDSNASFSEYKLIEIRPVYNATDQPIDQSVLEFLYEHLRSSAIEKGLTIASSDETTSGVLVVRSNLIFYDAYSPVNTLKSTGPAGWGEAKCILKTQLIDKSRNQIIAEVVAIRADSAGGVYSIPFSGLPNVNSRAYVETMKSVASITIEELSKLIRSNGP